jgi:hypothetical protein
MTCKEASDLVTEAMEGALDVALLIRFREHVEHCDACARFARQIEVTVSVLQALREPPPMDDQTLEALAHRLREAREAVVCMKQGRTNGGKK